MTVRAPAPTDEIASFDIHVQADAGAVRRHIFLHYDCVRTLGNGSAGKYPDGFATTDTQLSIRAGRLFSNYTQTRTLCARARHNRVAIHRGIIKRWQWHPGEIILSCKTIESVFEGNCSFIQRIDLL